MDSAVVDSCTRAAVEAAAAHIRSELASTSSTINVAFLFARVHKCT
jgi:hypothetical protein